MLENGYKAAVGLQLRTLGVYVLNVSMRFAKGVADAWYSGTSGDLWCEYKYLQIVPAMVDISGLLSAHQKEWLHGRHSEGRRVAVIVGSPDGGVMFPGLSWNGLISRADFLRQARKTKKMAQTIAALVTGSKQAGDGTPEKTGWKAQTNW